jgi:hypothetical protein
MLGDPMDWKKHGYRVGTNSQEWDAVPGPDSDEYDRFVSDARKRIEPWLSAVFQAEHFNLLLASGFTSAISHVAGGTATGMSKVTFSTKFDAAIDAHAEKSAKSMKRGPANIEDQFRSAFAVLDGLEVTSDPDARVLKDAMETKLKAFLDSLLKTEADILKGKDDESKQKADQVLQSFLMSFASRAASRERLHIFTSNYERLVEHGCDRVGLRSIDRFVGALNPVFRSSRVEVDIHYNPPGIRGEPRFLEGVVRLTKLHGSIDWDFDRDSRLIKRKAIPFGAPGTHTDVPQKPIDTVMIYPNAAKDVETTQYPYAELFRDFAAAICRPNAVVVTYGYGFGDDHINRVLLDMLTIPSTHLAIISYNADERLKAFCKRTRDAQVTLLIGDHFANIERLVENYLPKPALDYITGRMAKLMKDRSTGERLEGPPEEPPLPLAPVPASEDLP